MTEWDVNAKRDPAFKMLRLHRFISLLNPRFVAIETQIRHRLPESQRSGMRPTTFVMSK
jgi:hypothetical protein